MNRSTVKVVIIGLFLFITAIAASALENIWYFTPSRSFGTFQIGQNYESLEKSLRCKPDKVKEVSGGYLARFDKPGIIVQYNSLTGNIQFIGACKSGYQKISYRTKEGITVGSTKALVESSFSTPTTVINVTTRDFYPDSECMALYADKGIAFHYDGQDRVVVIIVFDPSLYSR